MFPLRRFRVPFGLAGAMRFRGLSGVLLLLAGLPGVSFAQAAVEGHVELSKSLPAPVVNKRYEVVMKGGVIATSPPIAVVYLEGSFPKPSTLPVQQMVQKNLTFVPLLLPVQVGTKVEFPNLDDTYHNIFSFSPAKRFDLGRYRSDERPIPSETFDVPGLVTLRCEIHEHMRGLILVLPTPYFTKTEPDGHFRLGGLPPGHYALKAWLDNKTTLERPVELKSGSTLHVDFP
jgi:plastocyanin